MDIKLEYYYCTQFENEGKLLFSESQRVFAQYILSFHYHENENSHVVLENVFVYEHAAEILKKARADMVDIYFIHRERFCRRELLLARWPC